MSVEEINAPLIHQKSAIVPSFHSNETMESLDSSRQLLVYSYTAICRKLKDRSKSKYLPEYCIPQVMLERLSEIHLAKLMCDLRNYIEEKFGRDSPKPRAFLKLPAKVFHDVSIDGPQHVILLLLIRSFTDRDLLFPAEYKISKEDPKDMLKLLKSIEASLLSNNLMPPRPVVFLNKVPVKCLNKLFKTVTDHGGKIVNSTEAATHVIEWNEEVDTMPEVLTDDFIRILEKRTTLSNEDTGDDPWFINRQDQLALVHWWYHPDCYNEWISASEIDSTDPPDVSSYWMTSSGRQGETEGDGERVLSKWAPLSCRFITDCELFNEWGNEFDYEITASTSDPTSWVVSDYLKTAEEVAKAALAPAPPIPKDEGRSRKEEQDGSSSGRKTRGRKRSVGGSASDQQYAAYANMLPALPVLEGVPVTEKVMIDAMPLSLRPDSTIINAKAINQPLHAGHAAKAARVIVCEIPQIITVEEKPQVAGVGAMEVDGGVDGIPGTIKKLDVRGSWTDVTTDISPASVESKEPTPSTVPSSSSTSASSSLPSSSSSVVPPSSSSSASSVAPASSTVDPQGAVPTAVERPKIEPHATDASNSAQLTTTAPLSHTRWLDETSVSLVEMQYLGPQLSLGDPVPAAEYVRVRNAILNLHQDNQRMYLSATECRRKITGDVSVVLTIHRFLDAFSAINRGPFLSSFTRPPDLMTTATASVLGDPTVVTPGSEDDPTTETGIWSRALDAHLLEVVAEVTSALAVKEGDEGAHMERDIDWAKVANVVGSHTDAQTGITITPKSCLTRFVEMPIAAVGRGKESEAVPSSSTSSLKLTSMSELSPSSASFVVLDRLAEMQRSAAVLVSSMGGDAEAIRCVQGTVEGFVNTRLEEERLDSESRLQGMLKDYMKIRMQILQHKSEVLPGVEALLDVENERLANESRELQIKKAQLSHFQQYGTGMS